MAIRRHAAVDMTATEITSGHIPSGAALNFMSVMFGLVLHSQKNMLVSTISSICAVEVPHCCIKNILQP